jgi:hypothetical protein
MSPWKLFALAAVSLALLGTTAKASAQIAVSIGPEPYCPYGYFDYAPYDCAPYGYYGPDWFVGGIFLGAGPWFHGPRGFYGHVDNRFDPRHGYAGPMPSRGERAFNHFHANEARDGRGNVGNAGHDGGREHAPGYARAPRGGGGHSNGGHH